jgi:hypothetical protein
MYCSINCITLIACLIALSWIAQQNFYIPINVRNVKSKSIKDDNCPIHVCQLKICLVFIFLIFSLFALMIVKSAHIGKAMCSVLYLYNDLRVMTSVSENNGFIKIIAMAKEHFLLRSVSCMWSFARETTDHP